MSTKKNRAPRKKLIRAASSENNPEWLRRIIELQLTLGLDQAKFASALGVTPSLISHWSARRTEPSEGVYVKLGNLAARTESCDPLWFWGKAGLDPRTVANLTPRLERRIGEAKAQKAVPVRILRSTLYVAEPSIAPASAVEGTITLPARLIPHPAATSALRVPRENVHRVFREGDLVIVDAERIDDFTWALDGIVAAEYSPPKIPVEHELGARAGVHIGWLSRHESGAGDSLIVLNTSMLNLLPEQLSASAGEAYGMGRQHYSDRPIVIASEQEGRRRDYFWRVLGRVIGWIAAPGKED